MSSIDNLYWVFLSTGFLVGFGHCIGMCGPVVLTLSLRLKKKGALIPHLLYNAGRITTYAVLGGIMGISGSFTIVVAHISVIQKGAMIAAGVMIVIMALFMSGLFPSQRIFSNDYSPGGLITKGFQKLSNSTAGFAYFPLGLLLGLLPCGPVYTALISAARAGMAAKNPFDGFYAGTAIMLCFGLGTMPALLFIGKLTDLSWLKSREMIYRVGSGIMLIVGVYFIIKGVIY